MSIILKRLLLYIAIVCFTLSASATHIVGGDVTYQHIGDNDYEVTLHMYIDCINGTQGAIAIEQQANISYFDAKTNVFLSNDPVGVLSKDSISEVNYKCLKGQPNACVQQFTYTYIKTIDPGANGVIITFQRCCRNHTISNLVSPGDVGATFFATIPLRSLATSNSSAVFKKLPPNFLCTQAPLVFDHSATDADGDSLVYSLILPYLGANPQDNRPIPAGNPPYNRVPMSNGFGISNMMNGSVKLQINPTTGLLRVTPNDVGQYVIAVLVEEYRDGIKINDSYRDYQLNVIECQIDVLANFVAPDKTCDKKVVFQNQSLGSSLVYDWDFGDEDKTSDKASSRDATWTYSEEGTYTIELIVFNDGCRDTFSKIITIIPARYINARFDVAPESGCDSLRVYLKNKSDSVTSFTWDMGDGTRFPPNKEVTEYMYNEVGKYTINLSMLDSNTCNITDDTSITVEVLASTEHKTGFELQYRKGCQADGKVYILSIDNSATDYTWISSDGQQWVNETPQTFSSLTVGSHWLALTTSDTGQCVTNDSTLIEYEIDALEPAQNGITLYNIFSPNGDTYNQCFRIDLDRKECIELRYKIYNRWGELIFEGNSVDDCWDGKDFRSGKESPEGEYFGVYLFQIDGSNEDFELSNVISLMR